MPSYLSARADPLLSRANRLRSRAGAPRRDLAAGAAVAVIVIQLAVAPLSLAVAAAFVLVSTLSRWRRLWLILPAVTGFAWLGAVGAGRVINGDLAAAKRLAGVLAQPGPMSAHLLKLGAAVVGWQHRVPGQLPLVLIIAAAEASIVGWSCGRRRYRPGLIIATRRAYVRASLRRGETATPGGCCVGFVAHTGRRAQISWQEAEGGVLVTGRDATAVTSTALELVTAAIGHRKAVIIIDLTGGAAQGPAGSGDAVADAVAAACDGAGAPLAVFGAERGHYEPFSATGAAGTAGVTSELPADPAATRAMAARLDGLRSGAIGAGLGRPVPGGEDVINLGRALAERGVVLFALNRVAHGRWAVMVAQEVIADVAGLLADRVGHGARADCLLWVNGFEATARSELVAQLELGPRAGAVTLLSTAVGAAAGWIADQVNVVAIRGEPPVGSAVPAASSAGLGGVAAEISLNTEEGQGLATASLAEQRTDGLSFRVRSPRPRLVTGCRAVR